MDLPDINYKFVSMRAMAIRTSSRRRSSRPAGRRWAAPAEGTTCQSPGPVKNWFYYSYILYDMPYV